MSETIEASDAPAEGESLANYEHRLKCMACSLHYSVYSYDKDWPEQREGGGCPECGVRGRKIAWGPVEMTDANGGPFIFMRVPGGNEKNEPLLMSGMWMDESQARFGISASAHGHEVARGPYGTNEGDIRLGNQAILNQSEDKSLHLVIEIIGGEERAYVTDDEELLLRAQAGTEQYLAESARKN